MLSLSFSTFSSFLIEKKRNYFRTSRRRTGKLGDIVRIL